MKLQKKFSVFLKRLGEFLTLLMPIFFPSWRFFSSIGPSPRVDYCLLAAEPGGADSPWQEYSARVPRLSIGQQLRRLVYNPLWNQQLYLNTCAEQLMESPSEFHAQQIAEIILRRCAITPVAAQDEWIKNSRGIKFRIRALSMEQGEVGEVIEELVFSSQEYPFEPSKKIQARQEAINAN